MKKLLYCIIISVCIPLHVDAMDNLAITCKSQMCATDICCTADFSTMNVVSHTLKGFFKFDVSWFDLQEHMHETCSCSSAFQCICNDNLTLSLGRLDTKRLFSGVFNSENNVSFPNRHLASAHPTLAGSTSGDGVAFEGLVASYVPACEKWSLHYAACVPITVHKGLSGCGIVFIHSPLAVSLFHVARARTYISENLVDWSKVTPDNIAICNLYWKSAIPSALCAFEGNCRYALAYRFKDAFSTAWSIKGIIGELQYTYERYDNAKAIVSLAEIQTHDDTAVQTHSFAVSMQGISSELHARIWCKEVFAGIFQRKSFEMVHNLTLSDSISMSIVSHAKWNADGTKQVTNSMSVNGSYMVQSCDMACKMTFSWIGGIFDRIAISFSFEKNKAHKVALTLHGTVLKASYEYHWGVDTYKGTYKMDSDRDFFLSITNRR